MRRTKIIATVGPSSGHRAVLQQLVEAGVDVFRLNFSHGTHDIHRRVIDDIRDISHALGRHVALLQDLSGPKIRTGKLRDGAPLDLKKGDALEITVGSAPGEAGRVSTTYVDLPNAVRPGDTLLLDDGRIELRVNRVAGSSLHTTVVDGGTLGEHKGINAPGVTFRAASPTPKDVEDLGFGVDAGVDFIALSFVQTPDDVRNARRHLQQRNADIPLIPKLERPQAVEQIDHILPESDAIMIARGDLGLELPLERVPRVQKDVTRRARAHGIPVIVATQVLESMRTETRPTRAEVSDAANAVDSGVDAIMLAGETAIGEHPVRTVQVLDAIIRDAEALPPVDVARLESSRVLGGHGRAICEAAVTLANRGDATAIVAVTRGGKTARLLSALRPRAPIFAATDSAVIARRLKLAWGVIPVLAMEIGHDVGEEASRIGHMLVETGAIPKRSVIVLVSITPELAPGRSNFLKMQRV